MTQAEPQADGATEAQHGDNSIASSTKDLSEPGSDESSATERAVESVGLEEHVITAQDEQPATTGVHETSESADQEEHGVVTSAISSAAESISTGASQVASSVADSTHAARERVADAASAVGASAGIASAIAGSDHSRDGRMDQPAHTLYVGNLFFDVTVDALKREMERFGTVKSIKLIHDGRGLSKGYVLTWPYHLPCLGIGLT